MANSSLASKLGIKPGLRLVLINPPAGYIDQLGALPEGVELSLDPGGQYDFVHLFVQNRADLAQQLPGALQGLKVGGLFWVAYPKRSARLETDLSRDHGWEPLEKAGWRGVSLISIDDTWSAMRFRRAEPATARDAIEAQYDGAKAALRPIYDRLVQAAQGFGADVALAPRKTYVGLVRGKVFGVIAPSSSKRVELGLKLKGISPTGRLQVAPGFGSGSITHKVVLTSVEELDEEVIGWMKQAYDQAV